MAEIKALYFSSLSFQDTAALSRLWCYHLKF
jgi:hypothetical protein